MIGIIDLDTGNIASLISAFDKINSKYRICKKPDDLIGVTKIVLPGVAAFKDYHQKIINKNFDKALIESKSKNYPILGICSGFQVFFEQSTEHGLSDGLGFLKGKFKAFNETDQKIQVPHVGWNECKILALGQYIPISFLLRSTSFDFPILTDTFPFFLPVSMMYTKCLTGFKVKVVI